MSPPYLAHLRVYEPLSAFDEGERAHWTRYVAERRAPDPLLAPAIERDIGLTYLLSPSHRVPAPGELPEHAFVQKREETVLVCPWRTGPRYWEALAGLPDKLPAEVASQAVDEQQVAVARAALTGWRTTHPRQKVHVQDHRWSIPVSWFLLVDAEERRIELGKPGGAGKLRAGRSVVYRTDMAQARRRLARGLAVLRRAMPNAPAVEGVEDVGRWLEEFHPRSLVELDYGGLVHLLDDKALTGDDSAKDVHDALLALARGDASGAAQAYDRIITRWQTAGFVESAN